nr:hypothetical protein GCM10020092_106070 [Actinoplanes digitatis]
MWDTVRCGRQAPDRDLYNPAPGLLRRSPEGADRIGSTVTTSYRTAGSPYPDEAPVSQALFDRAKAIVPGGVNSPVRAFQAVGGTPRFMALGEGPWMVDADGRRYVDLVCSWGAADPRARAPRDRRRRAGRGRAGDQLRHADRG